MNEPHIKAGRALRTMFIAEVIMLVGQALNMVFPSSRGSFAVMAGFVVSLVGLASARTCHPSFIRPSG